MTTTMALSISAPPAANRVTVYAVDESIGPSSSHGRYGGNRIHLLQVYEVFVAL
jgi:hypothetical protein